MTSSSWVVAVLSIVTAGGAWAADAPAAGKQLASLARFAGEWTVEGKWSDGTPLRARTIYEWGLGKTIMKARTFVMNSDREYQRYEGVLAWHPERRSLYEISFAYDGTITEVLIDLTDKDTMNLGWTPIRPDKPPQARQVIHFIDRDHFRWVVTLRDGENWKQLIDATWQRKSN